MLANRLKLIVGKVVSKAQNAFEEGRQILDAALVANKVIYSILKSTEGVVLCKLNIEKAYDHVDWSFLLSVIGMMGLGRNGSNGCNGASLQLVFPFWLTGLPQDSPKF